MIMQLNRYVKVRFHAASLGCICSKMIQKKRRRKLCHSECSALPTQHSGTKLLNIYINDFWPIQPEPVSQRVINGLASALCSMIELQIIQVVKIRSNIINTMSPKSFLVISGSSFVFSVPVQQAAQTCMGFQCVLVQKKN